MHTGTQINTALLILILYSREVIAVAILVIAYYIIRLLCKSPSCRYSYLAVVSALSVLLNQEVMLWFMRRLDFRYFGYGGEGVRSGAAGLFALVTGIVAIARIRKSEGSLRGYPFAVVGIIGGSSWFGYWAFKYLHLMLSAS
jgi:hypothetical protein